MLSSPAVVASSEVTQSPGIIQSLEAIRDRLKEQLMKVPEYRAFQAIETSIGEISHIQDLVDHLEVGKGKIKDRLMMVREYRAILAVEKSIIDITEVLGVLADTASSGATPKGVAAAPEAAAAAETAAVPDTASAPETAVVRLTPRAAEMAQEIPLAVTASPLPEETSVAVPTEVPAVAEKPELSQLVTSAAAHSDATAAAVAAPDTAPILETAVVELTPVAVETAHEVALAVTPSPPPEGTSAAIPTEVPAAEKPELSPLDVSTKPVATDDPPTIHEQSQEVRSITLVHDGIVTDPMSVANGDAEGIGRAKVA